MITLLFTTNPHISEILVKDLELKPFVNEFSTDSFKIYKHMWTILVESSKDEKSFRKAMLFSYSEYNPDIVIYVWQSEQISTEVRAWDIILPNVLFEFDKWILEIELNKENRDSFLGSPIFLENYSVQNDYDFENFWLRVGWISVTSNDLLEHDIVAQEKIRIQYEPDVLDDFAYNFVDEAKKLEILSKTYVILWVQAKEEAISLNHISHIVTFVIWNITWDAAELIIDEDEEKPEIENELDDKFFQA